MSKMRTKLIYVKPQCAVTKVIVDESLASLVSISVMLTHTVDWEEDVSADLPDNSQDVWIEW